MKKWSLFFFLSFLIVQNVRSIEADPEYQYFDEIALRVGADKASSYHNYGEVYSRYFSSLKKEPIKFLEIGIFKGNGVKLWEEYFPNAELHFIDITFKNIEYFSQRSHYHLADQESRVDLQALIQKTGGQFDIILDDGGHTMTQQITSFQVLFPHVKSGGMYIIEDLHTSYWDHYGGGHHPRTAIAFLKKLIDDVNFVGAQTSRASHLNIDPSIARSLTLYQAQIKSIHFYDSVAIILKW